VSALPLVPEPRSQRQIPEIGQPPRRKVAVLGATGSIGRQACQVISRHPDFFEATLLAGFTNLERLADLAVRVKPEALWVEDSKREALADAIASKAASQVRHDGWKPQILTGKDELLDYVQSDRVDTVLNAIVGFAGLEATLATLEAGKRLALANKESLVAGGVLVRKTLQKGGGELLPVDSEHAAVFECLGAGRLEDTAYIWLTCSGGPFRGRKPNELYSVTPEEALSHPTWAMGPKITVDSATLMNKGLEVIEAHFLFGLPYDRIRVVVHPQSIVHAMVQFRDGTTIAHLSYPNMENPILAALSYPYRLDDDAGRLDLAKPTELTFETPDTETFPCLSLAYHAGRLGGVFPAVLNAANEVAVAAFLEGKLNFAAIPRVISCVLDQTPHREVSELEELVEIDDWARRLAEREVGRVEARPARG
jgi:1-deoxy-D-xylulose-5-phosphate reductoisomerase